MKHFLSHLMPYPKLPKDFAEKHESAWVGHLIPLEKPAEFQAAVTGFLG